MHSIRVMTFNIRGSFHHWDDENRWEYRAVLNVATIRQHAPDLIGFQECQSGNMDAYREQLPEYQYVMGPKTGEEDFWDYNPIFWKAERFALIDSGGFWLSRTPDHWSKDWGTDDAHGVTWVKLRCTRTNRVFLHLNTHFELISEQSRVESCRLILQKVGELQEEDLPVLLTGDFNSNPWVPDYGMVAETTFTNASYHLFLDNGFTDTYIAAGNEDSIASNTYHGFERVQYSALHAHMAWRIDWILTRGGRPPLQTVSCTIVRDAAPPLYPSDHYPVLAELLL